MVMNPLAYTESAAPAPRRSRIDPGIAGAVVSFPDASGAPQLRLSAADELATKGILGRANAIR